MNYFFQLADLFLNNFPSPEEFSSETPNSKILINEQSNIGFTFKKNYSGDMANPPKTGPSAGKIPKSKPKKGLFDIQINSGHLTDGLISHRECFEMIIKRDLIKPALSIWKGKNPNNLTDNQNDNNILTILSLLMFEQEINWGGEPWQSGSNFNPRINSPYFCRPRDMIMGYILQAKELGIDNVKWWLKISGNGTPTFKPPRDVMEQILIKERVKKNKEKLRWNYEFYPDEYKSFFIFLQNDQEAPAIMTSFTYDEKKTVFKFRELAKKYPDNPYYIES